LFSCKKDTPPETSSYSISVRITKDPNFLNPLKSSAVTETLINQYIFLPLANYHPQTLQLIPVLIEAVPEGEMVSSGPYEGSVRYDCTMRKEARWSDGNPITGYDYLFTINAIKYEALKVNPSIRSVFNQMKGVVVNQDEPRNFSIFVNSDYLISKELSVIAEVLPEHLYDPASVLRKLMNDGTEVNADSIKAFVDFFNHADCGRTMVEGSGPYEILEWQTNQKVTLRKKTNFWGSSFRDNPYLSANPEKIIFKVFPSENTALTELMSGSLDVMHNLDGNSFSKLRSDDKLSGTLNFYNPSQLRYYYLGINNRSPFFNDKKTRWALAYLMDIDAFIANQENGMGIRTNGPIPPYRSYYNDTLKYLEFNAIKANQLMDEAGWLDQDGDGIREKNIDGELIEFRPMLVNNGRTLSKNLSLTLQQKAKDAGIAIEIITKNSKLIRSEIAKGNFDLYPTGKSIGLFPEDLYQFMHSDNDYPGGSNVYGISNEQLDELIEEVRKAKDIASLENLYREIQSLLYEQQNLIFLYSPTNNIAVNQRFEPEITIKKPGFFLNTFKLKA
jgi:peptide/nickel transport system substrate-binding protein